MSEAAVLALVAAAHRLRSDEALVTAVAAASGLSPEGVRWALAHHLENAPSASEMRSFLEAAGHAEEVAVILSANVLTASLRALALARAAAPRVLVRPSRREAIFARRLVEEAADPGLVLAPDLAVEDVRSGEIHVYGRDETISDVRRRAASGVRVRGHGAGFGVAFVGGNDALDVAAERLALDVIAFDQRGCLSPRIALVEGAEARSLAFARALHEALERLQSQVPRGTLSADERAAALRYRDTLAFAGVVHEGVAHLVGVAPEGTPLELPPPGRHVHVVPVRHDETARELLEPVARFVVCFGADDPRASRIAPARARLAPLGRMQRPPLDGPVDRR